jgi:AraC-like DNA-binding protein
MIKRLNMGSGSVWPKRTKGTLFYKLVWIAIIAVCVPIILIGSFYHYWSVSRTFNEIKGESQGSLLHVKDRMERVLEQMEKDSLQLALEPVIVGALEMPDYRERFDEQKLILQAIGRTLLSGDLIKDIVFYRNSDLFAISGEVGFTELQYFAPSKHIKSMLQSPKNVDWQYFQEPGEGEGKGLYYFMRRVPGTDFSPDGGVLVFLIKEKILSTYLEDYFSLSGEQNIYVVNEHNRVMFQSLNMEKKSYPVREDPEISRIVEHEIGSGQFFSNDIYGRSMLYTYVKTAYDRSYVSMIPEEKITGQLYWLQILSASSLLLLICLGVSLAYIFIHRAYNPISQLMSYSSKLSGRRKQEQGVNEVAFIQDCLDHLSYQSETIGNYMSKMEPSLRERFLQQLLEGNYNNLHLLKEDCDAYSIPINHYFAVLVVHVENVIAEKRFQPDDGPIISFAITNVMSELLVKNEELRGYIVRSGNGNGIAVLTFETGKPVLSMEQHIRSYAEDICESMRNYLTFKAAIGVGRIYSHIADIGVSYNEAMAALQYRLYKDTEPVLFIEDLDMPKKQSRLVYPRSLESTIVEALSSDRLEPAHKALRQFSNEVRATESRSYIFQAYHMLLSSLIAMMETRQISIGEIMEHDLFGELQRCQTARAIDELFVQRVFLIVSDLLHRNKTDSGKQVVQQICNHIREHIESDISLVRCAEMVAMSPSYISRLFKKELDINFQEFVMECKVAKTQQLLAETNMNLGEIAIAIGYSERNLIRIFQRYIGETPNQYRLKHR